MSEDIADAILLLLNNGADRDALMAATETMPDLDFIPVENLTMDTVH